MKKPRFNFLKVGVTAVIATGLVDRCERIRVHAIGEVHDHEARGRQLHEQIETLLSESANECGKP
jgi:hypothetical protein